MANIKIKYDVDSSQLTESEKQAKKLKDQLKGTSKETDKLKDTTEEAAGSMLGLASAVGLTNTGIGAMGAGMVLTTKKIKETAKGITFLKIAMLGLPIFAIIAAFTALFAWFNRTEQGAQKLRIITAALTQVWDNMVDVVIRLGENIFNAFSNPKQAVTDLWNAIKENLINRVTGMVDTFKFAGAAIQAALKFDWDGVRENAEKTGESLLQMVSGVDDLPNKIKNGIDSAREAIEEWGKSTVDNVNKAIALQERENALIVRRREWLVEEGKLQEIISKAREAASDQLSTDQERLENLKIARDAVNKLAAENLRLAKEERDIAFERSNLARSDEATLQRVAELDARIVELNAARAGEMRRITSALTGLEKKIRDDAVKAQLEASSERIKIRESELQSIAMMEANMIESSASSSLDAQAQRLDLERSITEEIFNLREKEFNQQLQIQNLSIEQQKKINDEIFKLKQQRVAFEQQTLRKEVELQIGYANDVIQVRQNLLNEEINLIKEQTIQGEITKTEANKRILEAERRFQEEIFDITKASLMRLVDEEELTAQQREDIEKQLNEARAAYLDAAFENIGSNFEKVIQRVNELFGQFSQIAQGFADTIFEIEQNNISRRLEALQEGYEYELHLAGDNTRLKEDIEEQYTTAKNALLKKQAEAEKKAKIFSAIINTASAVIQALASGPPPLSFVLAALTGALGAFQIATISSQQVPTFNKGTKRVPGTDTTKDSVHAILTPGEGVMPVSRMNEYRPAFEAMFDRRIDPKLINDFVQNRGSNTREVYTKETIRDSVNLHIDKHGYNVNVRKGLSNYKRQVNEYSLHG